MNKKIDFIYDKSGSGVKRILQVRDNENKVTIDVKWNNSTDCDIDFCNFIIIMACLGRGIEKQ